MNNNYKYDVFISWTGKNREEKNIIKKALIEKGIARDLIYDSEEDCKGDFRDDYSHALSSSKVYLVILSEHLLNDPNINGGYYSEVRKEVGLACDLEGRGMLNIIVFSCSAYFSFQSLPDQNDLGWFYYVNLVSQSQVRSHNPTEHEEKAGIAAGFAMEFIAARDAGKPKPSVSLQIPLVKQDYRLFENKSFSGRTDEIEKIDKAFAEGIRVIILSGIGGIGKTEIAKKYVNEHRGQYFCPQQITLSDEDEKEAGLGNLTSLAVFEKEYNDMVFHLPKDEQIKQKLRWLGELDERIILVIDNYNNLEEPNINAILEHLKCKVILTTRVTDIRSDMARVIEIEELAQEATWQMYRT